MGANSKATCSNHTSIAWYINIIFIHIYIYIWRSIKSFCFPKSLVIRYSMRAASCLPFKEPYLITLIKMHEKPQKLSKCWRVSQKARVWSAPFLTCRQKRFRCIMFAIQVLTRSIWKKTALNMGKGQESLLKSQVLLATCQRYPSASLALQKLYPTFFISSYILPYWWYFKGLWLIVESDGVLPAFLWPPKDHQCLEPPAWRSQGCISKLPAPASTTQEVNSIYSQYSTWICED